MEKYITENGITYELKGEQYYPVFADPKQHNIGKYGLMHLNYIKEHRRMYYRNLLMSGELNAYLHDIDVQAHEMLDQIIPHLAEANGITEELKESDPMRWVREMNTVKSMAEEIIIREIVII